MAKLACHSYHKILEEVLSWLEYLKEAENPSERHWLIFTSDVIPRFIKLLPDLISALNEASSDPLEGEPRRFVGMNIENLGAPKSKIQYDMISARIRCLSGSEIRERQCIGPIVGERGRCVGRGAATAGWQLESPEHFARKRNNFQARCKACDALRTQGRQFQLTRRSAAARYWLEMSQKIQAADRPLEPKKRRGELLGLSLSFLEELRSDWWSTLQHMARRLIEVSGRWPREPWLAVDVDRKLIFAGESPEDARNAGYVDDNMLILFRQNHVSKTINRGQGGMFL
jgi:hypothetical protein